MEKTDELSGAKSKHMANSPSSIPETSTNPKPDLISKTREEGELSSSDDDVEFPAQSVARTPGTAAAQATPVSTGQNKNSSVVKSGSSFPASNPESSVDFQSRSSVQSTHHKKFVKNRVPSKSSTSGWHLPSGTDNNLVIRFSDGDSGSDSEDYIQEKALESKGNAVGDNGKMKPPVPSSAKSGMLRQTIRSEIKPMTKKVPLSRPFVSAMNKINGDISRGSGLSLVEQGSCVRNFSAPNSKIADRQHGGKQGVNLNDSKLQGLREKIAIRESELKLKSAQQNKETVSGPYRNSKDMTSSFNNIVARKGRAASAEPEEPEKKRLKVSRPHSAQLSTANLLELPAAKSKSVSKAPASEKNDLIKMKFDCGQFDKITPAAKMQSVIGRWKKQDDNQMVVSLGHASAPMNDGADYNAGGRQHDRSNRQENPSVVLNHQTAPLMNMTSSRFTEKLSAVESKKYSKIRGHQTAACKQNSNSIRSIEGCKSVSGDKSLKVADGKLESPEDSPKNASLWNCMDNVNVSGPGNISLQSLLEIEDLQDKALEEAQEYRRRCEIEERNALKAYRKAQRALVEANARCSHLYREREVFSAQFQSFILDDSNLLWSSRQHGGNQEPHVGIRLNSSHNISGGNQELVPKSIHRQIDYDVFSQMVCDSNIHCINRDPVSTSYRQADGHNLGSDPCSEPDGSTSELMPHKGNSASNRVCSPSDDPNLSADDDTFSFDHESIQPNQEYEEREEGIRDDVDKRYPIDSTQDSLLLEASLRSKLFAQLGIRSISKKNGQNDDTVEPAAERGAENDPESEKSQRSTEGLSYLEAEKPQHSDFRGTGRPEETGNEVPVRCDNQSASHATVEPEAEEFREGMQSKTFVSFSPPSILRSAFGYMKVTSPSSSRDLPSRIQENQTFNEKNQECNGVSSEEIQPSSLIAVSRQETVSDLLPREISSYTCNLEIDPFWPLCMYELRGKCNDEECSWQHVNDHPSRIMNLPRGPHSADRQAGSSSDREIYNDAQSLGQCWHKSFSAYLVLSRLLQREPSIAEQFRHDRDGRIQIQGSWSRQSLYSQNGGGNQFKRDVADYIQSLERALLILNQEVNRTESMKKALSVMSRALEANPTSVVLWIVYLLIYYSNKKSVGKDDDMFFHAVKHNEGSYELWLLYINSRMRLDDRLLAYDTALTALCRGASAPDADAMQTSACILDLFLQMMDCLCMSRNVGKAIQRIYGLFPSTTNSNEPHSMLPSDIFAFLTVSDKCIFWVCCAYIVIYRKLPDAVVQRFECDKELFLVEWPSIEIEVGQKQLAVKLMENAMDLIELNIKTESLQSEMILRSVHLFALTHIGCIMALDGLECSRNLMEKYIKLYPSCLELFLIAARMQEHGCRDLSFAGFDEALYKWPKELPGIQCIWNQYAQYALENGRADVGKEVMLRWFHSAKVQNPKSGVLEAVNGSLKPPLEVNQIALSSNSNKLDAMFGMLNLALYRLLQNDHIEARLASDCALKAAAPENYKHCVREHAMFLLTGSSQLKDDASLTAIFNVLRSYLFDARNFPASEPLSRRFIQNIKKPSVQQLISGILSPISSDPSLVNLVLEVWHGPSLLPCKFSKLKDLVDFVEGIMEIVPSNHQLAFSVCKRLIRDFNSADITSASVLFWASSVLVNSIFQSVPVAPEYVFVEASGILLNITGIQAISEMFHKRALSVYPFSINLWRSYINLSKTTGDTKAVVEAAKERGIKLD